VHTRADRAVTGRAAWGVIALQTAVITGICLVWLPSPAPFPAIPLWAIDLLSAGLLFVAVAAGAVSMQRGVPQPVPRYVIALGMTLAGIGCLIVVFGVAVSLTFTM